METKFVQVHLMMISIISLIFITGCTNDFHESKPSIPNELNQFVKWGEIHNNMLDYTKVSYTGSPSTRTSEGDELYENLHNSLICQVDTCKVLTLSEKNSWKAYMQSHKEMYHEDYLLQQVGSIQAYTKNATVSSPISSQFQYALDNGIIDQAEMDLLKRLMIYVIENKENNLPVENLYDNILHLQTIWENRYSSPGNFSKKGNYSAAILSISIKSCEWWMENLTSDNSPTSSSGEPSKIAPWVAADIAGAVIGTGTYVLTTKLNGGNLSWKNGFVSVTVSATMASCGIVAKTAGWIVKVFK